MHQLTLTRIGFCIFAGCVAHTLPSAAKSSRPVTADPTLVDSSSTTSKASAILYQPGQLQYDLSTFSVVQALASDSTHHADSSRIVGILTTRLTVGPTHNVVTAVVQPDSVSLTIGSGTSVPIPSSAPFVFTIDTRTGRVVPNKQETARDCRQNRAESSPLYGGEVLPAIYVPAVDTWTDTVQTFSCRGGALLEITRIASYKRLQSTDSTPDLIRSTQFQITGSGYQWDQKIEVSGEGTSIDTLHLGGSPLRLQKVVGNSRAILLFRTQSRAQEFSQTATTHITLRYP
jgi:hypothetical protein